MARPAQRRNPLAQSEHQPATTLVEQVRVELLYDYAQLPAEHRPVVEQAARTIKPRLRRAAEDIFVIGAALNGVKARLDHGQFGEWLAVEFGLSRRMAQHFMNVAARLQTKSEKFSHLPPTSLYLLAAPSTPDAAIVEVEQKLDAGLQVELARVEQIVAQSKQAQRRPPEAGRSGPGPLRLDAVGRQQALELAEVLASVVARLEGVPVVTWAALFHNSELSRVRNELADLLRQLHAALGEEQI